MDKVAWIQWSHQVHTGKLPLTTLNLELIVHSDLPNEIYPKGREKDYIRVVVYCPSRVQLRKSFVLVFNYKMQYPAFFIFCYF